MELLSVQRARAIWLFDFYDLNPRGKDTGAALIEWLRNRYHFTKSPSNVNELDDTKALHYSGGRFQSRHGLISVELRIYNDGFVADSRSATDDTDSFLSDILESASKEFDLRYKPEIIRKKLYVSEMTVRASGSLAVINPKLAEFAKKLEHVTGATSSLDLTSVAFWQDIQPNPSATIFRFERKWGAAFSDNRYYSRAPLQTTKHLELLQEMEEAIS